MNGVGRTLAAWWVFFLGLAVAAGVPSAPPGLSVQGGVVTKGGRPFAGVGANYFSLFSRLLQHPDDTSSLSNLAALARAGIPFVRFSCCGFWPVDQQCYLTNHEAFLRTLDRVVHCAETNRIFSLIPLFAPVHSLV